MSTISFAGNLAEDPDLRYTTNGTPVAELVVLENRRKQDASGEWEDFEPNRYVVQVWRSAGENLASSVKKGDRVVVIGRIGTSAWDDKETNQKRTRQIVTADEIGGSFRYHTAVLTKATAAPEATVPEGNYGDDIPF